MQVSALQLQLQEHPFAEGLKPRHVQTLLDCTQECEVRAGQYLGRQGQEADKMYLIRSGQVALEIQIPHEGRLPLETIGPGEVLGWSWMVSPYRWRFDARAITSVLTFALDGQSLREKCQKDTDFGWNVLLRLVPILGRRLDTTRLRLLELYREQPPSQKF